MHTFRALLLCCLTLPMLPLSAIDWKQVERDYLAMRERRLQQGIPAYYCTPSGNSLLVSDPRPEFGLGAHQISQEIIDNMRKAHIRFVRITMYWGTIENTTEPGHYNEEELRRWDGIVSLFAKNEMIPLIVVHSNPPGASFATRVASYQRFAQFMRMAVKRYPCVRYWELFNEMDASFTDLFGAGVTPEVPMRQRGKYYAEMLKIVYPIIKEANPCAVVVTGGMDNWSEFPRGMYEGGARPYFDIMNMHTYGIPLQWGFVMRGMEMRQVMNENGDASKPLWNTEFGLDAAALVRAWGLPKENAGAYFDRMQAEMILDCLEFNRKAGLYQKCFAYQYAAGTEGIPDELAKATITYPTGLTLDDYGFGFTRRDSLTMRPVFQQIIERKINAPSVLQKAITRKVEWQKKKFSVKTATDYPTEIMNK